MAAAGRSAAKGRQFRFAFLLHLVTTPTEISACKQNEKLFRLLGTSTLHLNSPLVGVGRSIPRKRTGEIIVVHFSGISLHPIITTTFL